MNSTLTVTSVGLMAVIGSHDTVIRNGGKLMTYKTIVTDYAPKARKMAEEIESVINEKAKDGWEPVTFSVTSSCKAILVFRVPENTA